MRGSDGFLNTEFNLRAVKNKISAILTDGSQRLLRLIYRPQTCVIGVYPHAGGLVLAEVEIADKLYQLKQLINDDSDTAKEFSRFLTHFSAADDSEKILELVRAIKSRLVAEGWDSVPLAFCLPKDIGVRYTFDAPLDLAGMELREAMHWLIELQLIDDKIYLGEINSCASRSAHDDNSCEVIAVSRQILEQINATFNKLDLNLIAITSYPAGGGELSAAVKSAVLTAMSPIINPHGTPEEIISPAIFAALATDKSVAGQLSFEGKAVREISQKQLAISVVAIVTALFLLAAASDVVELYQMRQHARVNEEHLAQKMSELPEQAIYDELRAGIARREEILQPLMQQSLSWYGMLVQLGTCNVVGVHLINIMPDSTSVDVSEKSESTAMPIILTGVAASYDNLVEYMDNLKGLELLAEGSELIESNVVRHDSNLREELNFRLRVRLE